MEDKSNITNTGKKVLEIEGKSLLEFSENLDQNFEKAVNMISKIKGKVIIMGVGKSGHIGRKISATLSSVGTSSFFVHPNEALHGDLGMIEKKDLLIMISNSGNSTEIKRIMKSIKKIGPKIIAMTKNKDSFLSKNANISLILKYEKEACPLGLAPTVSSTLTLALGDALAIALMKKKNFSKSDYGLFHPGGSLGKESVKINSLISKRNFDSHVLESASLPFALEVLLSTKKGAIAVIDKKNKLKGIITDGDLKRYLIKYGSRVFEKKVSDLMTKVPISLIENTFVCDAIKMMKKKGNISVAPVVDKKGKFKGILSLHDLVN